MKIHAKKIFCVIAYDVEDDKKRREIFKVLEKYGTRINFSVFECLFTTIQLKNTQENIDSLIDKKTDTIVYYPICVNCFTKIVYQPLQKRQRNKVNLV